MLVRIVGQAPLAATVYSLERLRCGACGQVFTAQEPEGVGPEKYDETAAAMIAQLKRGSIPRALWSEPSCEVRDFLGRSTSTRGCSTRNQSTTGPHAINDSRLREQTAGTRGVWKDDQHGIGRA